jgi:ribonuclease HI
VIIILEFLLFTDGGCFPKETGRKFDSVASIRIFHKIDIAEPELIYDKQFVNLDTTGNYSEINAMKLSLLWVAVTLRDSTLYEGDVIIKLYTDSMLYHQSLTSWIYGWIKRAKNGILYNKHKEPVVNQEEIIKAFKIMEILRKERGVNIKFYHINSHVAKKNFKLHKKTFEGFNKCKLTDDEFLFLYLQNKLCDEAVKKAYDQYKLNLISPDTI